MTYANKSAEKYEKWLERTYGEADEAGEDTCHASNLAPRFGFAEEDETVGEAYYGTASTDSTDDGNHRVRVAKREHVDVVGDDQKHRDHRDDSDVFDTRRPSCPRQSRRRRSFEEPDNSHHRGLVEGIIDLNGIVVVATHEIFVVQTGTSADQNR